MQLGRVAYAFDASAEAAARPFEHALISRETAFTASKPDLTIQEIYRALASDRARNDMIVRDVSHARRGEPDRRSPQHTGCSKALGHTSFNVPKRHYEDQDVRTA